MANYCDCFIQIYNLDENKLLKDYDCVYEEIRTDHDGWVELDLVDKSTICLTSAWSAPLNWFRNFCKDNKLEGTMYFFEPGNCYHGYLSVFGDEEIEKRYDNQFEYLYIHNNEILWDELNYLIDEDESLDKYTYMLLMSIMTEEDKEKFKSLNIKIE